MGKAAAAFIETTVERTDQQLWLQVRNGDREAYTIIFQKYHHTLYNYGCKLSANSAVVEDAVQDVFIDIWRLRSNLAENITSVKFYLYRALRRRIHLGSEKFPVHDEICLLPDHLLPFNHSDSEHILIAHESVLAMEQKVQELLAGLPERQLEAITLRYFDDFSVDEIAHIMGVSEKSVRNFLYRGLTTLRESRKIFCSVLILSLIPLLALFF
jgi:RNA polymerase sigma factor (sigma-70 family)